MGFRSKEALARRADKRGISAPAQMAADDAASCGRAGEEAAEAAANGRAAAERRLKSTTLPRVMGDEGPVRKIPRTYLQPAKEGAGEERAPRAASWACPACGNDNFARREVCNSKTCTQARPAGLAPAAPPPPAAAGGGGRGVWICRGCGNDNFMAREVCNTKGCGVERPDDAAPQPAGAGPNYKKRREHKKAASGKGAGGLGEGEKTLDWAPQAGPEKIAENQRLKEEYARTGGEGMEEGQRERARVLVERERRKREKKGGKGGGGGAEKERPKPAAAAKPAAAPPGPAAEPAPGRKSEQKKKKDASKRKLGGGEEKEKKAKRN
ncbi:hypothetical protein TeGR_g4565 [Tetraparma gracilis]|uniref:RanBP2-type domain-containing protein n=1 Tax=Tetraparma gracilis TaxID=2962635 RepID=A0ABQ6N7L5_9STRA|nr:hypothetical protein TeGR_g4565 [Tetraparma gracilis]